MGEIYIYTLFYKNKVYKNIKGFNNLRWQPTKKLKFPIG